MLPAILCIDVEPDARTPDPRQAPDWAGFEALVPRIDEFHQSLDDRSSRVCWFVRADEQVADVYGSHAWALRRYQRVFDAVAGRGDVIGLHIHPYRRDDGRWIEDFEDGAWIDRCLSLGFGAYRDHFGRGCEIFRFGGRWTSSRTMRTIARLGAKFDLTVEPGPLEWGPPEPEIRWRFPDCSRAPRVPYRPSRFDFRRPGSIDALPLWALPVSTARAVVRKPLPELDAPGSVTLSPDPAVVDLPWERAEVEVSWSVPGDRSVDVRIDAPDGPLFCGGGSQGHARTGVWVTDGMQFFLRDMERGTVLGVAAARLTLRRDRRPLLDRLRNAELPPHALAEWIDLNLAYDRNEFRRALEDCIAEPGTRHLTIVCRSDASLEPHAQNLLANLELLAKLARENVLRFVSPETAVRMAASLPRLRETRGPAPESA